MPDDIPRPPWLHRGRRFRARDALFVVFVCGLALILLEGRSIRRQGEEMGAGPGRVMVLAVGRPSGWLADRLPLHSAVHTLTAWLSPDEDLGSGAGGFGSPVATASGVPPVSPDAFDPRALGLKPKPPRPLHTVLVTGDSMSMPLDQDIARRLVGQAGIKVDRDPHIGTGISKPILVDWGKLSVHQVKADHPDAVVVFIGANEGFSMKGPDGKDVACCSAQWAAIYADRARRMMNAYRQGGAARVYWLTLPLPRRAIQQKVARTVNAAVRVAAQAYAAQVRVLDMTSLFTPGDRYRDAMPVDGKDTIVRQADGIHLNDAGSEVAASRVLAAISGDFGRP
ncbi:MAG TPA: GDSL-type esterase/lipase family protein [Solirubrobacteraceae bacterium]